MLTAVTVLHAGTHLYTISLQALNPELKTFFGLTLDRDVTFFQTVYLIVYALSNLTAGFLVTRVPARTLLAIGPILNGVAVASTIFLRPSDYAGMCALVGMGALGGGLYHPVANVLLSETFPHEKGRALGFVGIGACVAFIAGPWGASILVHKFGWDWQHVALLLGGLGVLFGIAALLLLPRVRHALGRGEPAVSGASPLRPVGEVPASIFNAILKFMLIAAVVMIGREIASWGITAITSQYVQSAFGQEGPDPGFLMAMIFVPGLITQPLAGVWSDKFGRERVLAVSLLLLAGSLALLPYTPAHLLFIPYALVGAFMTATVPTFEALIADRTPVSVRGLIFGFAITAGIGFGALGPLLVGWIADQGQLPPDALGLVHINPDYYRLGFLTLGGITLICAGVCCVLKPLARYFGLLSIGSVARPADSQEPVLGSEGD